MVGGVTLLVLWLWVEGDWLGSPLASPAIHSLMVGAMAAIVALHALQSQHYGRLGTGASLAAFVGLAMYLVGAGVAYARDDFFLAFPATIFLVVVGLLLVTGGLIALGILTMNARVLPWWCGAALVVSAPSFTAFLGPGVGVAWVVTGYAIFRAGAHRSERRPQVP